MKRRTKYGNVPAIRGAIRFASQAEARRYDELLLLVAAGAIQGLRVQPSYPLVVNGEKVGTYIGDFEYHEHNRKVVEDVKSPATRTRVFLLKAKLLHALYGITVQEMQMPRLADAPGRGGRTVHSRGAATVGARRSRTSAPLTQDGIVSR